MIVLKENHAAIKQQLLFKWLYDYYPDANSKNSYAYWERDSGKYQWGYTTVHRERIYTVYHGVIP